MFATVLMTITTIWRPDFSVSFIKKRSFENQTEGFYSIVDQRQYFSETPRI